MDLGDEHEEEQDMTRPKPEGLHLGAGSRAVAYDLRKRGIELDEWAPRPEGMPPSLPEDVTSLSDRGLMGLFTRLSRWTRYLSVQVAAATADESSAARAVARAKTRKEDLEELEDDRVEAKNYHTMVKALYDVTDRDYKSLSREITRRTGRGPQEGRGNRGEES